jgi:hypothetical protein
MVWLKNSGGIVKKRFGIGLFVLTLGVVVTGSAQETWRNLRFGMPMPEVQSAFPAMQRETQEKPPSLCANFFNSGYGPIEVDRVLLVPRFCFSDEAAPVLQYVVLNEKDLEIYKVSELLKSLAGKYGSPAGNQDHCEGIKLTGPGRCDIIWRGNGQSVTVSLLSAARTASINIIYKPHVEL